MRDFVHLHLHTEYSLLDGACQIKKLIGFVKELGQKAVAMTDHGVMNGAVEFYTEAKKEGIKPIIGCEVYTAPRGRKDKQTGLDSGYGHLVLLAKDAEGYQNLIKMVSLGWTEGFYIKPRVDEELLYKYRKGLICTSACLAGFIPQYLLNGDMEGALRQTEIYRDIFGDDFYLELQDHRSEEQDKVNALLKNIAAETGIPLVATNDAHYIRKEDAKYQNILLCIQTANTVEEGSGIGFETDEFYVKSAEEMERSFSDTPEALDNTLRIAEKCNFEMSFGKVSLPVYSIPEEEDKKEYFRRICYEGLQKRYADYGKTETDRLDFELSVIESMGYVDYFLIVSDYVRFAKSKGIPVGPGRGSAAGSIVAYCLNITDVDPLKYSLFFERFLNPERVSMPDIDIDFCEERRQEVIDYVVEKYGADRVAQIITFGTMKARLAVRDVGRALGMSYQSVDTVAKLIPNVLGITIEKALAGVNELKSLYNNDPAVKELLDTAAFLEGMPRHASTHAAGIVMSDSAVDEHVPLQLNDSAVVTQYPMNILEQLGLLKMDFLGLRNLTVIDIAVKEIMKTRPDFQINSIPDNDKATFEMLANGSTLGVFQLESAGMTRTIKELKPESIEDIVAVIALYRPGPMDSIPRYIANKNDPSLVKYKHPALKDILDVTYGCIVYQEQVMQIVQKLAGYSYGRADILRRAMSKKKADVMAAERKNFIDGITDDNGNVIVNGTTRNGIDEKTANSIFDEMVSFAEYAFNKAHAVAYAVISYQTAYLKRHFPREYMAALLSSVLDRSDKINLYIEECKKLGISVLPPDINESVKGFSVSGENIRFGLVAIKSVGEGFIDSVAEERAANGKFTSFYDFCKRMKDRDINKKAVECLIKCGAFDSMPQNRRQLLMTYGKIIDDIGRAGRLNVSGQIDLFGSDGESSDAVEAVQYPEVEELDRRELLEQEKEIAGIYLSGHPMTDYSRSAGGCKAVPIGDIVSDDEEADEELPGKTEELDGKAVTVCGIISSKSLKTTKSGNDMAFISLEDITGIIECLVFPKIYMKYRELLVPGRAVKVRGSVSERENEQPKIIVDSLDKLPSDNEIGFSKLYIAAENTGSPEFIRAAELIKSRPGYTEVIICLGKDKVYKKANYKTRADEELIAELKRILGENKVVAK